METFAYPDQYGYFNKLSIVYIHNVNYGCSVCMNRVTRDKNSNNAT